MKRAPRKTSSLVKRAKIFPMKSKGNFSDSMKQGGFSRCPENQEQQENQKQPPTQGHIFASTTKRVLLAEPFTAEGKDNISLLINKKQGETVAEFMSEEDFFKYIYVEAYLREDERKKQESNILNDVPVDERDDDIIESEKERLEYIEAVKKGTENRNPSDNPSAINGQPGAFNRSQDKKCLFEESLQQLTKSVFVIKGVAGTGKTTYLHWLKRNFKKDIEFFIYNFEQIGARPRFHFIGTEYSFTDIEWKNNVNKFTAALLVSFSDNLKLAEKETAEEHRKRVKEIMQEYENIFDNKKVLDNEKFVRIFKKIFGEYVNEKINYERLSEEILGCFFPAEDEKTLSYVASSLIRLFFCSWKRESNEKKYLLIIDNIEDFISNQSDSNHQIHVCELERIVNACKNAGDEVRKLIEDWSERSFYAFLLVTRDTTEVVCKFTLHTHHAVNNEIDVSNWYSTVEIFERKKAFLSEQRKKKLFKPDCCYSKAYHTVIHDYSKSSWGLHEIVSKMYKNSHRRIAECVSSALGRIDIPVMEYFNKNWEEAFNNSLKGAKQVRGEINNGHKNLCRKFILRFLLNNIQNGDYIENLMGVRSSIKAREERKLEDQGVGAEIVLEKDRKNNDYARKIVTMLDNVANVTDKKGEFISFPRLIKTILERPDMAKAVANDQIDCLGKILFLMNEVNYQKTNWTPLVCLKFHSSEKAYSQENLSEIMKKRWSEYVDDKRTIDDASEFGVRVTEAGSLFAQILHTFEYFACGFLTGELPLFAKENLEMFNFGREGVYHEEYRAIAIIDFVKEKAFNYIDSAIEKDFEFYNTQKDQCNWEIVFAPMYDNEGYSVVYTQDDGKKRVHSLRIIREHKGYIENYLHYVEHYCQDEDFHEKGNKGNKGDFMEKLKERIEAYEQKFMEIKTKYGKEGKFNAYMRYKS